MKKASLRIIAVALGVCLAMLTTNIATAGAGSRPATPVLIETLDRGDYVSVKWTYNSSYAKVEVYRDSRDGKGMRYVSNVTSGNVLNDYIGQGGAIYQLIAYDNSGRLSHRSTPRTSVHTPEAAARMRPVVIHPDNRGPAANSPKHDPDGDRRKQQAWVDEWNKTHPNGPKFTLPAIDNTPKPKPKPEHKSSQDERDDNQRDDGTRNDGSGGATRGGDAGDGLRG